MYLGHPIEAENLEPLEHSTACHCNLRSSRPEAPDALAALTAIATIWLVNGVVWFARLHYRLLKPALDPQPQYQA